LEFSLNLAKNNPDFKNIKVIRNYQEDLPEVLVDKNKIQQVFLNIILNAIQAMPQGGTLTLKTYIKELNKIGEGVGRRAQDFFRLRDNAIFVEIEDTGHGISKENISKIFNPFFSTKGVGKGVGLGLSITKTIIDSHKGLIRVESKEGEGTKFIIILPPKNIK
jgi:two-component system NtrC family sensor kinase